MCGCSFQSGWARVCLTVCFISCGVAVCIAVAQVLERAITPGPGDYVLPSTLHVSGGTWLDMCEHLTLAVSWFFFLHPHHDTHRGRYTPKSEIERIMEKGRNAPGPGSYPLKSTLNPSGGSWSFYSPKSDIEWAQERAAAQPGPGEYDVRPTGPCVRANSSLPWI